MMKTERNQFTFYKSFAVALKKIKKSTDRAKAYDMIVDYALYGIEPDLEAAPDIVAVAFDLIRPNLDAAAKMSKGGIRSRKGSGKVPVRSGKGDGNKGENNIEIEKESLDSFSIENESAALAPSRPDGGGAARRYGTYDPEAHKRPIVYKEFGSG